MKLIARQRIWLAIVLLANFVLWMIPSNVVEEVARQRHVMLGRYSRTHFAWIVAVAVISLISFYIDWSTGPTYKRRWFQTVATLMFLLPSLVLGDFLLRSPVVEHFVRDRIAFRRPPSARFEETYVDRPEPHRSYPQAPTGWAPIRAVLTTDGRGYRNRATLESAEIVVLGDSFAEGSHVSDEHAWPARLAERAGKTVYNLSMSSYDPLHYLESLKDTGLSLRPRVVLCLIYEGNDFRVVGGDDKRKNPPWSKRLEAYVDRSPILRALDQTLIDTFGPIRADAPLADAACIDWMPLAIPLGSAAKHYAFEPKQLRDHYISRDEFSEDPHWLNPRRQLREMNELCRAAGARFVVIYAPTKAHVTFPLVADRLDPQKVRGFTAMAYKYELPQPAEFLRELRANLDAKEEVVGEWCAAQSVPFLSLTGALREAALAATQVYYTYDQHWTPPGHEVVADAVQHFLETNPASP